MAVRGMREAAVCRRISGSLIEVPPIETSEVCIVGRAGSTACKQGWIVGLQIERCPAATAMALDKKSTVTAESFLQQGQEFPGERVSPGPIVIAVSIDGMTQRAIAIQEHADHGHGIHGLA